MINLENRIERDELIDDYFNKGLECNIKEVYQAVVNTVADLEYANDEKINEIERLNKARKTDIEYNKYLQKEIIRLNNIINEFDKLIENEINESKLEDDYDRVDSLEYCLATLKELKGSDKE